MPRFFSLGLTGYPLEHSLSPILHLAALRECGLGGEYRLYPVPPGDQALTLLADLTGGLRRGELHGLNVTIPHKQTICDLLDGFTPAAQAIGAVNTLYLDAGRLVGDNTDAPGFLADLHAFMKTHSIRMHAELDPMRALVLGAGGAARAVVYALTRSDWAVTVAARHLEQAQAILQSYEPMANQVQSHAASYPKSLAAGQMAVISLEELNRKSKILNHKSELLIVNATPLGMSPNVDASPWPPGLPFPSRAIVYDLVYNPSETSLVRAARRDGLPATTGLGMLVEQAALAFERWTGLSAPRQAMRQAAG
jgi:shikimate dehydrogenase